MSAPTSVLPPDERQTRARLSTVDRFLPVWIVAAMGAPAFGACGNSEDTDTKSGNATGGSAQGGSNGTGGSVGGMAGSLGGTRNTGGTAGTGGTSGGAAGVGGAGVP